MEPKKRDLLRRIVMECASKLQEDPNPELATSGDWDDLAEELDRAQRMASDEAIRLFSEEIHKK